MIDFVLYEGLDQARNFHHRLLSVEDVALLENDEPHIFFLVQVSYALHTNLERRILFKVIAY